MNESESKSWMSYVGWGCLIVTLVAVLGIGGCVAWVYRSSTDAHAVAEAYLAAVDAGNYDAAFQALGPDFTEDRGLSDFVAFEQAARAELGSCGDWTLSGTSFNRQDGNSVALLTFRGTCDDEPVTVSFSLEQLDRQWLIQDIRYNEPMGPVLQICVDCGGVVPPGANFCPFCGAAADGDDETADAAEPEPGAGG
jgi:hypothetical protein